MEYRPIRIQRKRTKGWRMPENTVSVDRMTKWGNPFIVNPKVKAGSKSGACFIAVPTIQDAIDCFREYIKNPETDLDFLELRGKNLACWCKEGDPCHADVLLELANNIKEGE